MFRCRAVLRRGAVFARQLRGLALSSFVAVTGAGREILCLGRPLSFYAFYDWVGSKLVNALMGVQKSWLVLNLRHGSTRNSIYYEKASSHEAHTMGRPVVSALEALR
jgi:hypothetical protein